MAEPTESDVFEQSPQVRVYVAAISDKVNELADRAVTAESRVAELTKQLAVAKAIAREAFGLANTWKDLAAKTAQMHDALSESLRKVIG